MNKVIKRKTDVFGKIGLTEVVGRSLCVDDDMYLNISGIVDIYMKLQDISVGELIKHTNMEEFKSIIANDKVNSECWLVKKPSELFLLGDLCKKFSGFKMIVSYELDNKDIEEVGVYNIDFREMRYINIGVKNKIVSPEHFAEELCGFQAKIMENTYYGDCGVLLIFDIRLIEKNESEI